MSLLVPVGLDNCSITLSTWYRDIVRAIMKDHFPDGFDQRSRSALNRTRHTATIQSFGPNEQLSIDGHDKLLSIGFPIYGMKDKYSRKWISLATAPSNRTNMVTGYLFLKVVKSLQGK